MVVPVLLRGEGTPQHDRADGEPFGCADPAAVVALGHGIPTPVGASTCSHGRQQRCAGMATAHCAPAAHASMVSRELQCYSIPPRSAGMAPSVLYAVQQAHYYTVQGSRCIPAGY